MDPTNLRRMEKVKQNLQDFLRKPEVLRKSKNRKADILAHGSQPLQSKIGRRLAHMTSIRQSHSADKTSDADDTKSTDAALPVELQVKQDIAYLEQLVSKGVLEQLPGAVTVVMETATRLDSLIDASHLPDQRRSSEVFQHHLYQSLADLVRWADLLLLDSSLVPASQSRLSVLVKDVREKMMNLLKMHRLHDGVVMRSAPPPRPHKLARGATEDVTSSSGVHSAAALSDTDRRASVSSDELSRRISCCSDSDLLDKNAYETIRSSAHLPNTSNGRLTLPSGHHGPNLVTAQSSMSSTYSTPSEDYSFSAAGGVDSGTENMYDCVGEKFGLPPPLPPKESRRTAGDTYDNIHDARYAPFPLSTSGGGGDAEDHPLSRLLRRKKDKPAAAVASTKVSDLTKKNDASSDDEMLDNLANDLLGLKLNHLQMTGTSHCGREMNNMHASPVSTVSLSTVTSSPVDEDDLETASSAATDTHSLSESLSIADSYDTTSTDAYSCASSLFEHHTATVVRRTEASSYSLSADDVIAEEEPTLYDNLDGLMGSNAVMEKHTSAVTTTSVAATTAVGTSVIYSSIAEESGETTDSLIGAPPKLPEKRQRFARLVSEYDNFKAVSPAPAPPVSAASSAVSSGTVVARPHPPPLMTIARGNRATVAVPPSSRSVAATSLTVTSLSATTSTVTSPDSVDGVPPPLPPKRRNMDEYLNMMGDYVRQPPSIQDFSRHSVQVASFYEDQWFETHKHIFRPSGGQSRVLSAAMFSPRLTDRFKERDDWQIVAEPPRRRPRQALPPLPPEIPENSAGESDAASETNDKVTTKLGTNKTRPLTEISRHPSVNSRASQVSKDKRRTETNNNRPATSADLSKDGDSAFVELSSLEDTDINDQLVWNRQEEDGNEELKGGSVDALIVYATLAERDNALYEEAFLTTYRTFVASKELLDKLIYRYHHFRRLSDVQATNTFSLIVRVVDELSLLEVCADLLRSLMDLVWQLVCDGELEPAVMLRGKFLTKHQRQQQLATRHQYSLPVIQLPIPARGFLGFKSLQVAESMTLLDSDLFHNIELSEVLLWSREQNEEQCPNLARFTEHFNKVSYWCRTRILEQEDSLDREKYFAKFLKVMKHLRRLNNFNSFLALLSAVDSAPVRRLDWPRQLVEVMQDFSTLIDSSSSFRNYRQALAEARPPCIPYIGLVLQDLTFVNIGNRDNLPDGNVNFTKRWQQFTILDNMRRFDKRYGEYLLKKNYKILDYINGFDKFLDEDTLWSMSEHIKPRGSTKTS